MRKESEKELGDHRSYLPMRSTFLLKGDLRDRRKHEKGVHRSRTRPQLRKGRRWMGKPRNDLRGKLIQPIPDGSGVIRHTTAVRRDNYSH